MIRGEGALSWRLIELRVAAHRDLTAMSKAEVAAGDGWGGKGETAMA